MFGCVCRGRACRSAVEAAQPQREESPQPACDPRAGMGLCSRGASCWRPTIITCCGGVCLCVWCGVLVHQDDDEHVHIEDETKGKAQSFHANQAFDGGCSQQQMFESCGITGLIDAAIEGFPVCCFAYGQTGSGKTHTIIGEESFITRKNYSGSDVDGLIPRAGKYLFERAAAMKDRTFRIRASFLEIYNEQACCCAQRGPRGSAFAVGFAFWTQSQLSRVSAWMPTCMLSLVSLFFATRHSYGVSIEDTL